VVRDAKAFVQQADESGSGNITMSEWQRSWRRTAQAEGNQAVENFILHYADALEHHSHGHHDHDVHATEE